jgi:hypothetical protein
VGKKIEKCEFYRDIDGDCQIAVDKCTEKTNSNINYKCKCKENWNCKHRQLQQQKVENEK